MDLSLKIKNIWYTTLICNSKKCSWWCIIRNLPDAWRTFLIPRMTSISDLDQSIGFVSQNTYNLMYNTYIYLQNWKITSGHPSGSLPDFGGRSWRSWWRSGTPSGSNVMSLTISVIWKRIGVNSFIHLWVIMRYIWCNVLWRRSDIKGNDAL